MKPSAFLFALILLPGCGAPAETGRAVEVLPEVDLRGAEEGVREQLERQRAALLETQDDPNADPQGLSEAYADLGLLYLTYDFLEPAGACFRNARLLDPDDYRWSYLLGYLATVRGELPEAIERYEKALVLEPGFLPAILRLGRSRLDLARYEASRADFERALELSPDIAAAYEGLARVAAAAGRHEEAVGHFERALALEPGADRLHYALAQSYRDLGRLAEARDHLARSGDVPTRILDPLIDPLSGRAESLEFYLAQGTEAIFDERFSDAAASFRAALERDPASFRAYRGLGLSLQRLGDLEGASRAFEEAVSHAATGDAQEDRKQRAGMLRALAGIAALQGRQADTLEYYLQSLAQEPDQRDVLLLAGNALARAGRFADAVARYDRLIELEPAWAPAVLEKRATALVNLGRGEEAIGDFERAVAAAPADRTLRLRFAEALAFLGRSERAASERARAESLTASASERAALKVSAARQAGRDGDLEVAVRELRAALELVPGDLRTRFELASVLGQAERLEEAADEFERVIREAPRHDGARRGQIAALLLDGRYGEARVKLQEALKIFPRHAGFALVQVRLLATVPDAAIRDGGLALRIAERLHAESDDLAVRRALALAYAAAGRFKEAVELQREVLAEEAVGNTGAPARLGRARLAAFERGRAWAAETPHEILGSPELLEPSRGQPR